MEGAGQVLGKGLEVGYRGLIGGGLYLKGLVMLEEGWWGFDGCN